MKLDYDFLGIERKWQERWAEKKIFFTPDFPPNKYYCLVMFPYPSGDLHIGHVKNYVIGDVVARTKRQAGYTVLHPFGWDAFGLPAENAAITHQIHPEKWTKENIAISRENLIRLGISYDWEREIITCQPGFYRWNQFFFLKFYERGLAYRKSAYVNWCPGCSTVLANEQVVDGHCYRSTCNALVEKRKLEQWFFKITSYAERLLQGIEQLRDWPESVKTMQRNWIGKSVGVEVEFEVIGQEEKVRVFTTRPDTVYGVTFIALAPEAEITERLIQGVPEEVKVRSFIERILKKPEFERQALGKTKEGIFIGRWCINPLSGEKVPIFIADYVLATYGTGCLMGVPAHDQRDFEFARHNGLPIRVVISPPGLKLRPDEMDSAYTEEGVMVNSGQFSNLPSSEGRRLIADYIEEKGIGRRKVSYRLRDWLISRQRYWGTPIPMVHCEDCGIVPVPYEHLPVLLPKEVKDWRPLGKSVLAGVEEFINTTCPRCQRKARRDPDTMDTFVDSSWYFLRYLDPKNEKSPFSFEATRHWLPIDKYIGGIEHACGHLIFFRFFTKVLYDLGLCAVEEPCLSLFTQGMVLLGGKVMSSSRGHGVWVGPFLKEHGADCARLSILFAAPPEKDLDWQEEIITGTKRFLNRVKRIFEENNYQIATEIDKKKIAEEDQFLYIRLNQTIKQVKENNENFQFNTAIARLMEFLNDLFNYKKKDSLVFRYSLYNFLILLSPFAPHLCEEIWERCGFKGFISQKKFPDYDPTRLFFSEVEIPIQIQGKLRSRITVPRGTSEEEVKARALADEKVKKYIKGCEVKRIVYIKDKLINIVLNFRTTQSVEKKGAG